ncbi:protein PLASTID MOVEMENT IMPAIRED 1-RELATED 1-like [Nicotiana tomentosiformis]|uniref:protein PLASTID MOVEMENT IMPAIRED 1-RELATED 1-like n=1 Tax=Nicotiana tomentosiformis TaxID=4098 RepID=UPI00388C4EB0
MMWKVDSKKKIGANSGKEKLLNDIEAINKALYLDKTHLLDSKSKNKGNNKDSIEKESKKSIWSWKGLKSLAARNKKFNCCFSVHRKRRDGELTTRPVVVSQGVAEFEEQLTHTCSISGGKNGPNQSAKYEAKHFLLYASIYDTPELDLGKHRVDLTRLLPLSLDELEENSSGKWTTSFRLAGKAKGAILYVSFEYHIVRNTFTVPTNRVLIEGKNLRRNSENAAKLLAQCEQCDELSTIRRTGSLTARSSTSQRSAENIKYLHEVLPVPSSEVSVSVNVLYQKLEEEKVEASVDCKPQIDVFYNDVETIKHDLALSSEPEKGNIENGGGISEVSIREQGVEVASNEWEGKEEDTMKTGDSPLEENVVEPEIEDLSQLAPFAKEVDTENEELSVSPCNFETDESANETIMKEVESALKRVSDLANEGLDSQEDEHEAINHDGDLDESLSLDYVAESVASDFLDMLGIEHSPFAPSSESEPDSPREGLLRQFEKDTLASGCSLFNLDMDVDHQEFGCDDPSGPDWRSISEDFDYSSNMEMPKIEIEATNNKTRATMLEDLETEALMREWGLNEKAFQYSPPKSSSGFGSPIDAPLEEDPYQLPPLAEGLGPFIKTKNGGLLRSMNPTLFKNSKSRGSLIMQVSSPVVVPAEMGSGIMDILQHLASIGIEKLSMQASKLMPLEDITGQTMQHIAWETAPSLDGTVRQDLLQQELEFGQNMAGTQSKKCKRHRPKSSKLESNSVGVDRDSEYVSIKDLAPLAMDKIEALSIEGLKIQSGMSDEGAPSNLSLQSIGQFSAIEGKKVNFGGAVGLEGTGGLRLLDVKDNGGDEVDGLMGLSLTLEEWMRLDSGEIDDADEISERTSKLLAAHHATCTDMFRGRSKGEKRRGKGKKCGLLGNNLTVVLMVQLRDPLRNYEPVGTPMLALVQVERVFVTPKSKIYSTISGSPIDAPLEEDPYQLPPLAEDLGPFIKTKNGGLLWSMNPTLFKNSKSGGSLIMQVSSPVVVPAEMGSGIMDILQHLASIGIEKLSMQASKLMPLEDITGQTMQHIAWETAPSLDGTVRQDLLQQELEFGQNMAGTQSKKCKRHRPKSSKLESNSVGVDRDSEYVSIKDLAPLAMDKIEALSIEGLKIQSGMSDEGAQSIGQFSAIEGKKVNFGGAVGLEGTGGLRLLDVKDNGGDEVDGLMGLSLTLEEWMRLDSGEIDDADEISERTSKLLAAHHAICTDMFRGRSKGEKRRGKGKKCGLLGNNLTVVLMVQLRDPLRNYEPVGTPMLALVQVERVFVTPKSKIYRTLSEVSYSNEDDDDDEYKPPKTDSVGEVKEVNIPEEEQIPQCKFTEVHVAGLKTEKGKKKLWGSSTQQQSGSRWLLANGMGKKNKHPLLKSKASNKSSTPAAASATTTTTTTTVQPGETLWSISSRVHGTGAKWKELAALNPHIRNPNVIFPFFLMKKLD